MSTRTSRRSTSDDNVQASLMSAEPEGESREGSGDSEREAEENRELSRVRAAAYATSTAGAAIPVDDTAVSQPESTQPSLHVDNDGVERITSGTDTDGWEPAPSDPHPSQVAAAEERNARFEAQDSRNKPANEDGGPGGIRNPPPDPEEQPPPDPAEPPPSDPQA